MDFAEIAPELPLLFDTTGERALLPFWRVSAVRCGAREEVVELEVELASFFGGRGLTNEEDGGASECPVMTSSLSLSPAALERLSAPLEPPSSSSSSSSSRITSSSEDDEESSIASVCLFADAAEPDESFDFLWDGLDNDDDDDDDRSAAVPAGAVLEEVPELDAPPARKLDKGLSDFVVGLAAPLSLLELPPLRLLSLTITGLHSCKMGNWE